MMDLTEVATEEIKKFKHNGIKIQPNPHRIFTSLGNACT